jgi:tRNA modification GTPase
MKQADLVLYIFDVNEMEPRELETVIQEMKENQITFRLVGNKIDRGEELELREKFSGVEGIIFIAAKDGRHLEVLEERMIDVVLTDSISAENVIVTNARHYHALLQVSDALKDIREGLEQHIPGDLLSLDIRRCLHYLGEITGEITNEDQLDYIFSKFCIGK